MGGLTTVADLAPSCNKNLVSDLLGAATFLHSALTGCGENVMVNAHSLSDKTRRGRLEKEYARLVEEGRAHHERVQGGILRK